MLHCNKINRGKRHFFICLFFIFLNDNFYFFFNEIYLIQPYGKLIAGMYFLSFYHNRNNTFCRDNQLIKDCAAFCQAAG